MSHGAWGPAGQDVPHGLAGLLEDVRAAAGDPVAALALADRAVELLPVPGSGRTAELWRSLGEIAAVDLTVARALEPHLDAHAILEQARREGYAPGVAGSGAWGVFAAEGPGTRLEAHPDEQGRVVLSGRKPWCSLAAELDHALVTAWVDERRRVLVAIDLDHPGVSPVDQPWVARGLGAVRSTALDLSEVPGTQVGPPGWYLSRPGFAWGGMGVAACWLGGAIGLARRLREETGRREPDQVALLLLGEVDARITAARAVLDDAAEAVDTGRAEGEHAWARCVRTRHVVHDACESVLRACGHGLGPGPLTAEEEHASRVADLEVYLRQHKAERDAVVVGQALATGMGTTW